MNDDDKARLSRLEPKELAAELVKMGYKPKDWKKGWTRAPDKEIPGMRRLSLDEVLERFYAAPTEEDSEEFALGHTEGSEGRPDKSWRADR